MRAALGLTGLAVVSTFGTAFMETAYAAGGTADRMLVVLSLRGAADGLSLVVPHGDPVYYQARPSIAVPKDRLLFGDSFFGLHPSLKPIGPLWREGKVAAVHAAGQLVTTRSHFAAMEEVEDADPGSTARVGWLNRLVAMNAGTNDFTSVQLGSVVQATQSAGPAPGLAAQGVDGLRLAGPGGDVKAGWEAGLASLWPSGGGKLGEAGRNALGVARVAESIPPSTSTAYPDGDLGDALRGAARLLKANVGAEVITVDQGSWDHHSWVGNLNDGNVKRMTEDLGLALAAFFEDLGTLAERVTLVTVTEFGRRVKENANQGLDHGHGSVMFIMGAGVKGGYYGRWPGIQNTQDADLPVTTDYRDVLAEVAGSLFPTRAVAQIFPGLTHRPVGFMKTSTVPEPDPEPEDPTPPAKTSIPESFFTSMGSKSGSARVGSRVRAPRSTFTPEGQAAGVAEKYVWETVKKDGSVIRRGTSRSLRVRRWRGQALRVRVVHSAPGYASLRKTYFFGKVK